MPLSVGQSLAFYEILGPLGAGAMGDVYRAKDTRLDREVAIKVLPEHFAEDEERLRRFEREAKTLASLNHPNVAGIHGIDQVDSTYFIAMELVTGEDLSARLERGPLAVDEAIDVCRQIAEGLEAAHEAGVVHRDLKPANVRVTPEGVVKVLDFGLAKPLRPRATREGTSTAESDSFLMTEEGLVLGTPTYMSPEQARGRPIDRRTDIWAFGCVLYECLTGKRAFEGETFTDLVAGIIEREADLDALPARTPPHVRALLMRTLAKDPRSRLRDIGEARFALTPGAGIDAADSEAETNKRWVGPWLLPVGGAAILVIGLLVGGTFVARTSPVREPDDFVFRAVTLLDGLEEFPSLSPDGKSVVYSAKIGEEWDILSQRIGGTRTQNLTEGMAGNCMHPALSPDGELIAFRWENDGGGIYVMGATGESPRRVTDFGFNPCWSPDGTRLALVTEPVIDPAGRSRVSRLFTVDVVSGEATEIEVEDAMQPAWSPNGRWIAFWAFDQGGQRDLAIVAAEGGTPVRLTEDPPTDWSPTWTPDGTELVFCSNRGGVMNLWRLGVDPETGSATGVPRRMTSGVGAAFWHPSYSADGSRLVFCARTHETTLLRVPFDPERRVATGLPKVIPGSRGAQVPNVSPDGEWLAFHAGEVQEDLHVMRVDGSERRQVTDDIPKDRFARWSLDGARLYSFSDREAGYQIWSCALDGSDMVRHTGFGEQLLGAIFSPSGERMACQNMDGEIFFLDGPTPTPNQVPSPAAPYPEPGVSLTVWDWSPDGKWVLVGTVSDEGAGLTLLSADGTTYQDTRVFSSKPIPAAWLPDTSGAVYAEGNRIFLWDMQSGESSVIVQLGNRVPEYVTLSPDGRWLYIHATTPGADIWIADIQTKESP